APAGTKTVWPEVRFPAVNRHSYAVPNATGTQAAGAASSPAGIGQVIAAGTARLAAWDPAANRATTRSPAARPSTPAATSLTVPALRYPTTCGTLGNAPAARAGRPPPSMLT